MAVFTLKFEEGGFTIAYCIQKMQTERQTVKTLIRLLLSTQQSALFAQTCLSENLGTLQYVESSSVNSHNDPDRSGLIR